MGHEHFKEYVQLMRETATGRASYNRFPWQARIVVDEILNYAMERDLPLKIFTSDHDMQFYGEATFLRFVDLAVQGQDVQIVIAEPPKGASLDTWRRLADRHDKISVRAKKRYDHKLCHFCLAGKETYRVERPHGPERGQVTPLSPECPARFAFNNRDEGQALSDYWNIMVLQDIRDI